MDTIDQTIADAAAEERAKVVLYLRRCQFANKDALFSPTAAAIEIERGAHLKPNRSESKAACGAGAGTCYGRFIGIDPTGRCEGV